MNKMTIISRLPRWNPQGEWRGLNRCFDTLSTNGVAQAVRPEFIEGSFSPEQSRGGDTNGGGNFFFIALNRLGLSFLFFVSCSLHPDTLNVAVSNAQKNEKTSIILAFVGNHSSEIDEINEALKKALEFKGQLAVATHFIPKIMTKKEALAHKENGYHYIVFITAYNDHFAWHLFSIDDAQMIKNKKVAKKGSVVRASAYALADSINETLTNDPAFFSTKIAYAKEIPVKNGIHYKHIYIADYDGSNEQAIVQTPTINVSPRWNNMPWNNDARRPLLFYSENANANMRMNAVDLHKKRVIASNFEGINMLPAFSPDGSAVVYCATRGSGSCQLYYWSQKKLKKLTQNTGNNFAPTFSNDGKIIFFNSDFETGKPQIYSYNTDNAELVRFTADGFCVSPTHCPVRNQLAYSKMVNGVMQLFAYDLAKQTHAQLTFDAAQKEECVWSPCGTFLLCSYDDGKKSRIALFNTITYQYTYLTKPSENCYYPAWSGVYNEYPVIS